MSEKHLLARHYKEESVDNQVSKVLLIPQSETLQLRQRNVSARHHPTDNAYYSAHSKIAKTLRKHLNILS